MPNDEKPSDDESFFKSERHHEDTHKLLVHAIEQLSNENFALQHVIQALVAMEEARNPGFKANLLAALDTFLGQMDGVEPKRLLVALRKDVRQIVDEPNIGDMLKSPPSIWRRWFGKGQ